MNSLENFKLNFECPTCLETLVNEVVNLNCTNQHKMCLNCAKQIFGEMKGGMVSNHILCPMRCPKPVSAYSKESFIQNIARKIDSSILSIIEDLKCPSCKKYLENDVVTLNCAGQHKMCLPCAQKIFKRISKNKILRKKVCPLGCKGEITKFTKDVFIQNIVEQAKKILIQEHATEHKMSDSENEMNANDDSADADDFFIRYILRKRNQMIQEGMSPATASYILRKKPWVFYPAV